MKQIILLALAGVALASDTPDFTEVRTFEYKGETIEERTYPSGQVWACYDDETSAKDYDMGEGFWPLFKYIQKENDRGVKIEMTRPVSTKVKTVGNIHKVSMCFYLENKFQQDPPKPTNDKVKIVTRPEYTVYTRREGGWMTSRGWRREHAFMEEMAEEQGLNIQKNLIYINGYNSPFELFNRRNELWLVKAE